MPRYDLVSPMENVVSELRSNPIPAIFLVVLVVVAVVLLLRRLRKK